MTCGKCGAAISPETSLEVPGGKRLCSACFLEAAGSMKALSGQDRERLKKAVKEDLAGLLPREALSSLIEEGYGRLVKGADFDEEVGRLVNEIERLAGLAISKEILAITGVLKAGLEAQEEEIRGKIRRIESL